MIQLNYRDSKPIYEQIREGLRRLVITGAIAKDEKLPSVRELASELAINPNTIQRAYRELETEGYIYTVSGKGSFAAEQSEQVNGVYVFGPEWLIPELSSQKKQQFQRKEQTR